MERFLLSNKFECTSKKTNKIYIKLRLTREINKVKELIDIERKNFVTENLMKQRVKMTENTCRTHKKKCLKS